MATKKTPAPTVLLKKPLSDILNFPVKVKYSFLFLLAFCFYANSFSNEYVLDDEAIIQHNEYVQQGFSGIGKILSKDAFDSYYKQNQANQHLTGGRYRPLSIVLFAIEHQLWGESPYARHVINVLLYALCVFLIFYFLRNYLCRKILFGEDIAFISAILFAIHPIHTEVVANIKSSDEILSLMLIMMTFIFSIKFRETKKIKNLAFGLLSLFLALLAKEYAVTVLLLLPILFMLYFKEKFSKSMESALPYFGVIMLYLVIRISSIGLPNQHGNLDILNDPYLYMSSIDRVTTKIFVAGKYLAMLLFPYPLAADYGFAQIPGYSFASPWVWLSLIIYAAMIYMVIKMIKKNNIMAFPVIFYLFSFFMVSNFFLNIGTTMGERLIFHSSLGFVIIISWGIITLTKSLKLQHKRSIITSILVVLVVLCGAETINRNKDWKTNFTLFTKDVKTVPNSILANNNAGLQYVNLSETIKDTLQSDSVAHKGISYLKKAIRLDSTDLNAYLNLGIGYSQLIEPDLAKYYWDIARKIYPEEQHLPGYYALLEKILFYKAQRFAMHGQYKQAIHEYETGTQINPSNADLWFYLGGTFYNLNQYDSARNAWQQTASINPNYPNLSNCLGMLPKKN